MQEDHVGIAIGGQINILYIDGTGDFVEGADDEERVKRVMESFV